MNHCFIVTGVPRSGTSMVAGIMDALGVDMGGRLLPPDQYNESGYWEDADFSKIHRDHYRILDDMAHPEPPGLRELVARRVADSGGSGGRPWGFKDPLAVHHVDNYRTVMASFDTSWSLVVTRRPFHESVLSLAAVELSRGTPGWCARRCAERLGLSLFALERSLAEIQAIAPDQVVVLDYARTVRTPRTSIETLAGHIRLWAGQRPDRAAIDAAVRTVRPELKHY